MDYNAVKNPTNDIIHTSNTFRKSCSSINVGYMGIGRVLRESHSFTDGLKDNFKIATPQNNTDDDIASEKEVSSPKENSNFYIWTKQVNSFEPYMVFEEMLNFQGRRYSQSEIAPIWKKDCRMWLWKTRNTSGRIQKKVKNFKCEDTKNVITNNDRLKPKQFYNNPFKALKKKKKYDVKKILMRLSKLKL